MKKYLLLAIAALASLSALAVEGDMSIGAQFNYGSRNSMYGLGVQFQIEPVNHFRIAPEFIYYFEDGGYSAANANLNFHYLITSYSGFTIYPIAGFAYSHIKHEHGTYETNKDRYGANVGCGTEYSINKDFKFYVEERFQILKDWNQSVTTLGLKYTF